MLFRKIDLKSQPMAYMLCVCVIPDKNKILDFSEVFRSYSGPASRWQKKKMLGNLKRFQLDYEKFAR